MAYMVWIKVMKQHRITARSKVVEKWYDKYGREWGIYTCGVTGHTCSETIKVKTGRKRDANEKTN